MSRYIICSAIPSLLRRTPPGARFARPGSPSQRLEGIASLIKINLEPRGSLNMICLTPFVISGISELGEEYGAKNHY